MLLSLFYFGVGEGRESIPTTSAPEMSQRYTAMMDDTQLLEENDVFSEMDGEGREAIPTTPEMSQQYTAMLAVITSIIAVYRWDVSGADVVGIGMDSLPSPSISENTSFSSNSCVTSYL